MWGSFSPLTGDTFWLLSDGVNKALFLQYLSDFSQHKPEEFKILVIDNASFHSTKDFELPKNIFLMPLPPYCPELNPAEKVWQWLKSKIAMKFHENLTNLENTLETIIQAIDNVLVKSITSYHFYLDDFYSVFND